MLKPNASETPSSWTPRFNCSLIWNYSTMMTRGKIKVVRIDIVNLSALYAWNRILQISIERILAVVTFYIKRLN